MASDMDLEAYNTYIQRMREDQYPMLKEGLYLDHAGTTLYSKSLMDRFHADMMANLYGNPHSASPSSQRSTQDIEAVRMQAMDYFHADPEVFDLVFTSNTTAAIKLVMEAFRSQDEAFTYVYHVDSHTSLVGVREAAKHSQCLESDEQFQDLIRRPTSNGIQLAAWPAQSNMNGRRLPFDWARRCPEECSKRTYTLLDAAAYAATKPLRLDDARSAPDFIVLSFSKIFGFPDLGALIVKKDCAHIFESRAYFGGGTVDMVACLKEAWHAPKSGPIHEMLEDGTLPIHGVIALRSAMETHTELFRSLDHIAEHTAALAKQLHDGLSQLRHANGELTCKVYKDDKASYDDAMTQGPTIAFNICDNQRRWISNTEVEKLASVQNIHLRTGGLCNPGGIAKCLNLSPWEIRDNFSAGHRCGGQDDVMNGKPTGVIRVSLGAMSVQRDVERFIEFIDDFFVDKTTAVSGPPSPLLLSGDSSPRLYIESLTVYPIKSCGGWQVPHDMSWDIRSEGLRFDREWCIVKKGTGKALSQKMYPRMALIRPNLDLARGVLRIKVLSVDQEVTVPLSQDPNFFAAAKDSKLCNATVCNDKIQARVYTCPAIAEFLTRAIGTSCTLARFPASSSGSASARHSKAHLISGATSDTPRPIFWSNESPILTILRSSLNRLNETIKKEGGKAAHPAVFRANIVLAESPLLPPGQERPWVEDAWEGMQIGDTKLECLGGCRRCQMVCVDQDSGEKNPEPFLTLAKTRRFAGGRVLFGVHTALADGEHGRNAGIRVGDNVATWDRREKDV